MIDPDINQFVDMVGATEPSRGDEIYATFRRTFRRHNYFTLNGRFLIVKISRIEKPFWGAGKEFIDFLNNLDDFFLVLLVSPREGWVFSKSEVNANINSGRWRLREADNNYKIHTPLPGKNAFATPTKFLERLGLGET